MIESWQGRSRRAFTPAVILFIALPETKAEKARSSMFVRMAGEDSCEHDMLVQIRWQGRKMGVPLSQLEAIGADESTQDAVGDWHYWVAQGYCL